ncbi:tRNA pseudouridine(13) synthase TruD [Paraferrimonas haliotis]|uniref:tRNA pseudouridine synthase D n=1 Tax=Paraferrimonas haliotis TaxID=2013866 RepID=A0AA37TUA2_9GAMM|nr:tRNA pseudouridine(13) synthase TruD [Paraferrimonas haliotis]GLS82825.1 tRNA pseudouridine synthase D [Paraferrimonas haliotis]
MDMTSLTYLHGKPSSQATLRAKPEDFQVTELLPIEFDGEGEHFYLYVRKIGQNTAYVAKVIARFAGVPPRDVSVAGQKDRHAVTEQWFCVRLPGKETPSWTDINTDQIQVLDVKRHRRKLRTGALLGNQFKLCLRDISDSQDIVERIAKIEKTGVPNYYGEQRFGHGGANVDRAIQMFAGKKAKDRHKRSMYLSAARSFLFNLCLSERLQQFGLAPLAGDAMILAGSNSYFKTDAWDETLEQRLQTNDIGFSGPLWGQGELASQGQARDFELSVCQQHSDLCQGLESYDLKQERKGLLLRPQQLRYELDAKNNTIILEFVLPSGAFATSVVRELTGYQDAQAMEQQLKQDEAPNENSGQ